MLRFSTTLPLRAEVTKENCIEICLNWLKSSQHYDTEGFPEDLAAYAKVLGSEGEHNVYIGESDFSIVNYAPEGTENDGEMSACRVIASYPEADYTTECIFQNIYGCKSISIQLDCTANQIGEIPSVHKPYIVRMFVESGLCDIDMSLDITDRYIVCKKENSELCANALRSSLLYLPIVYLSRTKNNNWWNTKVKKDGKIFDPAMYLANELSGVAHVICEGSIGISKKMIEATGDNCAYNGFVGIHYPGKREPRRMSIRSSDGDAWQFMQDIIHSVWDALSNNASIIHYDNVKEELLRYKLYVARENVKTIEENAEKLREHANEIKAERDIYEQLTEVADKNEKELKEQIKQLQNDKYELGVKIDSLAAKLSYKPSSGDFSLKKGDEDELYDGELNDLILSILSQVKTRYAEDSRGRLLIDSLLNANERVGECERILNTAERSFDGNGRLNESKSSDLKSVYFSVEKNKGQHPKLVFKGDNRYMFTISGSPGDHRAGKNLISEIRTKLDVEKKI